MILIDTNALIILIIGLIDTKIINNHKKTSIYEEQDYYDLLSAIDSLDKLIVLPNVWTEVDNLLNKFGGDQKYKYVKILIDTIKSTSEKFIDSLKGAESENFYDLGLTDSLILDCAKECELLITSDSTLSDYAIASGIKVYDVVKNRNERLTE